jgi:hypothetical protein
MQELLRIRLPFAVPFVFGGLKVAAALAVVGAVVAEFVGADAGLGYLIQTSMAFFRTPLAFGAVVILALMGIVLFWRCRTAERVFFPWSSGVRSGAPGRLTPRETDMAEIEAGFTLIRGALLADPALRRAEPADVLIQDGVILEVGANLAAPAGARIVDAAGLSSSRPDQRAYAWPWRPGARPGRQVDAGVAARRRALDRRQPQRCRTRSSPRRSSRPRWC